VEKKGGGGGFFWRRPGGGGGGLLNVAPASVGEDRKLESAMWGLEWLVLHARFREHLL